MKIDIAAIETTGGELAERLAELDPSDRKRLAMIGVDPSAVRRAGVIAALREFFERANTDAKLPTAGTPTMRRSAAHHKRQRP